MPDSTPQLSDKSNELLIKFNICIERYVYYIKQVKNDYLSTDKIIYIERLNTLERKISSTSETLKILKFSAEKLEKFSDTYNVDVSIIDDIKLVYFIALYFLREDEEFNDKTMLENNIILIVLHKIMCTTLLAYEPIPILEKLEEFICNNTYKKFEEEYGDIGYYHMIKSIFLMQELGVKAFMNEESLKRDDVISTYFNDL